MPTLAGWLQEHGLEQYADVFARSEIDLDVMPDLTEQDLEKLGLPLGARKRFMRAIRSPSASSPAAIDASHSPSAVLLRAVGLLATAVAGNGAKV